MATTVAQLLAVRRGSFVSVVAIVEALWDEEPPPAVSRLRKVLGAEAISGGRTGYRWDPAGTVAAAAASPPR
jgi:DNA-binding SARP family transcriptional activator